VLCWALQHFAPADGAFGGPGGLGADPWRWCAGFAAAERAQCYPVGAYVRALALSALLAAVVDTANALGAHAEASCVSGAKLAKLRGL
jgi:hypothetical protein